MKAEWSSAKCALQTSA